MASNPDLEAVVSYVKSLDIYIDFEEFKFQVATHPDYPSLLSFSDALTFFKIPNVATRVPKENLENMPDSFVVLLRGTQESAHLSFVRRIKSLYIYSQNEKTEKATTQELKSIWNYVILLIEKPKVAVESTNKNSSSLFFILALLFATIAIIFWFSESSLATILAVSTIAGIYLSVEALKTELGIESIVSKSFCQIISNADCEKVINSTKKTWLQRFKISDISLWFFGSQLLSLFFFCLWGQIQIFFFYIFFCISASIPLTIYSIYFQKEIEKKWCPICLTIIGLLYAQFLILLFNQNKIHFEIKTLFLFCFGLLLMVGIIFFLKPILLQRKYLQEKNIVNVRFKRNYILFKNNLISTKNENFDNHLIILGNHNAKLNLTIVTSPFCAFCKDTHEIFYQILKKHKDSIKINLRFNFNEKMSEKQKSLFYRLIEIYKEKGDLAFSGALKNYYDTKSIDFWLLEYGNPQNNIEMIEYELLAISNENQIKSINFTPNIFINGYIFPNMYEKSDLIYFINDLIDDEFL